MTDEKVTLPVDRSMFEIQKASKTSGPRKEYWLGLLPTAAHAWISIGGISFTKYTNPAVGKDKETGLAKRRYQTGSFVKLTQAEFDRVMERLSKKVYRVVRKVDVKKGEDKEEDDKGDRRRAKAFVYNVDNARYTRSPNDQPLAKYVYMMKSEDAKGEWTRATEDGESPPSVYDMATATGTVTNSTPDETPKRKSRSRKKSATVNV